MVKLINFIRGEGKAVGRWPPDLSSKNAFQSEYWLMPQLEDDALLYSLHDVIGDDLEDEMSDVTFRINQLEVAQPERREFYLSSDPRPDDRTYRIAELEQRVKTAQRDLDLHKQMLAHDMELAGRLNHDLTLEEDTFTVGSSLQQSDASDIGVASNGNTSNMNDDTDSDYFASYSGHGDFSFRLGYGKMLTRIDIHATMLKDTVRTDAFRDFILENKDLFKDKIILDVGCGTGILSLFCARAGAKKIFAVDNSDIISFAQENVFRNGMGETITLVK